MTPDQHKLSRKRELVHMKSSIEWDQQPAVCSGSKTIPRQWLELLRLSDRVALQGSSDFRGGQRGKTEWDVVTVSLSPAKPLRRANPCGSIRTLAWFVSKFLGKDFQGLLLDSLLLSWSLVGGDSLWQSGTCELSHLNEKYGLIHPGWHRTDSGGWKQCR